MRAAHFGYWNTPGNHWLEFLVFSVSFLLAARFIYNLYTKKDSLLSGAGVKDSSSYKDVTVAKLLRPFASTFNGRRGDRKSSSGGSRLPDTSTGGALDALRASPLWGKSGPDSCPKPYSVINRFLAVWIAANRNLALEHEGVLRHMARIGDFREAFLAPELVAAYGAEDHISSIREAYIALKLCCWLNTLVRRRLSAPYLASECAAVFDYLLPRFGRVLQDPESVWTDWQQEYTQVVSGFDRLVGPDCCIDRFPDVGLAVIVCPEPLHYYSLFSHTVGADVVLTVYDGNRYEVECKYTQYVPVHNRPVWPRLDMGPLAMLLNDIEGTNGRELRWAATRYTEAEPLLRLERSDLALTDSERYGHPCDRPIYPSNIPPTKMQAIVQSFLEFGQRGAPARQGGWTGQELQELNQGLHWSSWAACCMEQHNRGELDFQPVASPTHHRQITCARAVSRKLSGELFAMTPGSHLPQLSAASHILSESSVRALSAALPPWYQQRDWRLAYSTHRDGISLATLLRKCAGLAPTILCVRDSHGFVFGAYAPEAWRVAPRFFGNGETFVFQVEPSKVMFSWKQAAPLQNDYFLYCCKDCLAVGGSGHWAVYLDNDLLNGSSGACDTFSSPCLASAEEFKVMVVEVWHVL